MCCVFKCETKKKRAVSALCHSFFDRLIFSPHDTSPDVDIFTSLMRTYLIGCCICLLVVSARSQFLDLARLEHTYVPGTNANFEYQRTRFVFNYPFKLKEGAYLFSGIDYSNIRFRFHEEVDSFDKNETDDFTLIDLNLTYTFALKNDWRFALQVSPGVSSNFESGFERNDWVFSSIVAFIKDRKGSDKVKKPNRIIIGAAYSGSGGVQFPIPFIRYYRKFHPKWSYNIGAPISNLQWHASENFRFKLFATLDGFNSNLQREQVTSSGERANRLRLNMLLAGTRYEYKFSDHIESFVTITRSFNAVVQLRNGRERVLRLPADNVMHYRIGLRCKI